MELVSVFLSAFLELNMEIIADLHFHSKYSRAVSPKMILPEIAQWAEKKGIDLVTTADFTHPLWIRELRANLEEAGEGIYRLKVGKSKTRFLLTTEVACIYRQEGRLRRIHLVLMAPNLEAVEKINEVLGRKGNLMSDGRPIFGLTAKEMTELVLNTSPDSLVVPAHIWTPHFSLYGSQSGFDSINECFGNYAKEIKAIETGLSSDPAMNWRVKELDSRTILSFSDAHSPQKLGREATVFKIEDIKKLRYEDIKKAIISEHSENSENQKVRKSDNQISRHAEYSEFSGPLVAYTIEFYPEEGKYHWTGHRNCGVKQSPEETARLGAGCPVCGRHLTVGVMHRVQQLAARELKTENLKLKTDEFGVKRIGFRERPPYVMLVPLIEIIAESLGSTVSSQKSLNEYEKLTNNFGGEFSVLLQTKTEEIGKISGPRVAEGIKKARSGDLVIEPGYDGVFGTVKIWPEGEDVAKTEENKEQLAMF
jgi:PHP family Zn ribbon phosphoesterase